MTLAEAMRAVSRCQQSEERLEQRKDILMSQLLREQAAAKRDSANALEIAASCALEAGK